MKGERKGGRERGREEGRERKIILPLLTQVMWVTHKHFYFLPSTGDLGVVKGISHFPHVTEDCDV